VNAIDVFSSMRNTIIGFVWYRVNRCVLFTHTFVWKIRRILESTVRYSMCLNMLLNNAWCLPCRVIVQTYKYNSMFLPFCTVDFLFDPMNIATLTFDVSRLLTQSFYTSRLTSTTLTSEAIECIGLVFVSDRNKPIVHRWIISTTINYTCLCTRGIDMFANARIKSNMRESIWNLSKKILFDDQRD
jgi:hypothetical protein